MSDSIRALGNTQSIRRWLLLGAFGLSLGLNLAFAIKFVIIDPNYPFHPLCHAGRHFGLVVLTEPMSQEFKREILANLYNARRSRDGGVYVPRWRWWRDKETLWNATRSVAEDLYERRMGKARMTKQEREKLQPWRCTFIRKYALKNPKADWKIIPAE